MKRVILHIDMDAFFASVEQADFPEYKGKPVIVGSDPKNGSGRGVVSTCSYEARKFGVRAATPISTAYKLCPHGIFVRPRMRRYIEVSDMIMGIFQTFSPIFEQISIDEGFLDCTGSQKLFGSPETIAGKIQERVFDSTGLTLSIGIAATKSIAKIASDMKKPNGITVCPEGFEEQFLSELPVSKLWGAGTRTVEILNEYGIFKIRDIQKRRCEEMGMILGKSGIHLWYMSKGIDDRPVETGEYSRKSISEENTFEIDTSDYDMIEKTILHIVNNITHEMRISNTYAKTVNLKIRFEGFETYTRSRSIESYINDMKSVKDLALEMIDEFKKNGKKVRLIGVGLSNLEKGYNIERQIGLFEGEDLSRSAGKKCDKVFDEMKKRYGSKVKRASLME